MTLPIDKDPNVMLERPGDEVFESVKPYLKDFLPRSEAYQKELVDLILNDVIFDHAVSKALDDIGKIIEYQAQCESVEKPKFFGLAILKDTERVGKLKFILGLCKILGFDAATTDVVRAAEVDRLWGKSAAPNNALSALKNALSHTKGTANDRPASAPPKPERQRPAATHKGHDKQQ
jgi:hypothetical protein